MTRLYVLVEGQTEEEVVKTVLAPHLQTFGVWVSTLIVETSRDAFGRKARGGGRWQHWRKDLTRLTRNDKGKDVRFTTLFDLYRLPKDFPELEKHSGDADTAHRADRLADAMAASIGDNRLIPYLQRHEFEALVLASLDSLAGLLDDAGDLEGVKTLRSALSQAGPEDINDGEESAPSKRLMALIPRYRKTVHGTLAVQGSGLGALRSACPRFDRWVAQLEHLGQAGSV